MQLNGLGLYQSHSLTNPWSSATKASRANFTLTEFKQPTPAGGFSAGALGASKSVVAVAGKKIDATGRPVKVGGAGDEVSVSPTSSTRAEVSRANLHSQTAQAAVTTAKAVNDSLGKTETILGGLSQIVSTLTEPGTLTQSHRRELSGQFSQLADYLDNMVEQETFAGHKVLDGKFRATFTIAGESRVTVDATLPNGKPFNVEGLGLKGFAGFLAANGTHLNPVQGKAMERGIEIARGAVAQVRSDLTQAAADAVQAMTESSPLVSPEVQGTRATALNLVAKAQDSVMTSTRAAYRAQSNIPVSAALRLLS